ncbi:unnamed protein product [Parajaminaea phylloscopi]
MSSAMPDQVGHAHGGSDSAADLTPTLPTLGNATALNGSNDGDDQDLTRKKTNDVVEEPEKEANFGTHSVDSSFDRHAAAVLDEAAIEAAGQGKGTSTYIWSLTAISAISGMLFGYDTGAINSVLVQTGTDIGGKELTSGEKELITSGLSVGAIIGSLLVGYLADKLGRKRTLVFCDVLFIVGAVVQAAISTKWPFVIGRFLMGIGVGAASMICPVFISEVSPVNVRGKLVTLNVVAITGGQVLATAIGAGFQHVSSGWRWIIALGAIPPLVQGIVIELFFPESPRHLQKVGQTEKAALVLAKMYPRASSDQIKAKIQVLANHIASDTQSMWSKYRDLFVVPQFRRAAFLAALLQTAQQLSGFNALMYYSATLFSLAGLKNSVATSLVVSGVNFVVTCAALPFLDRFGRRNFLLCTIPVMIFGLLFGTVVFVYLTKPTNGFFQEGHLYDSRLSAVMIVSQLIFVAGYAGGLGHVPWGSAGDFFDQTHRGVGASSGAFPNWAFNLVVSSTFLRLMESITPAGTFGLYAGFSACLFVAIIFLYPETLGLSLEQANSTVVGGFHVKRSVQLRKQNVKMLRDRDTTIAADVEKPQGADRTS